VATDLTKSAFGRGVCPGPGCGQEYALTKAGVMRHHWAPQAMRTGRLDDWTCAGVGRAPVSVAPDPIVVAETRGYDRAIADLRAEADRVRDDDAETSPTMWAVFSSAADFLRSRRG
jgi:hypothetical protein